MSQIASGLPNLIARIIRQLPPPLRRRLIVVIASMLLGAVLEAMTLGTVLPFLAVLSDPAGAWRHLERFGVHSIAGRGPGEDIRGIVTAVFILVALSAGVMRLALAWNLNRFVFAVGRHLSSVLFQKILRQDYTFHVQRNSSELITKVQEIRILTNNVLVPLMQSISALMIGGFIVASLLVINPVVALVAFVGFGGCYVAISLFLRKRLKANSEIISRIASERLRALQESLGGVRDVILDGSQDFFVQAFTHLDRQAANAQAMVTFSSAAPRFILEALGMALIAAISLYFNAGPGGLLAALPTLAALAIGAQRLLPLMQQGYSGYTQLTGNWRTLADLLDLLEIPDGGDERSAAHAGQLAFAQDIVLKDVSFQYSEDRAAVLSNVNLRIPKGGRVGVIGKTGGGKSTLVDILMGLLPPSSGVVEIDQTPLTASNRAAWQMHVAHVPQSIFLADTTVENNIAFGVPDHQIDRARVRAVAAQAQIADFIEGLPKGYGTRVGELGSWLSGGQRQRIGVARALYKRASVLVLDEATSALDTATEAAIMEAVESLGRELTIIVIAHRLSTLANCDTVVELGGGKVLRNGPPTTQVAPATLRS